MMDKLRVVLLVALTGAHLGRGLPVGSTPHGYPHNTNGPIPTGWKEGGLYAAVPVLALIATAVALLIGCTWCYRRKDCKQNEGADNQLFTASATHLHERRSHPPDSGFSEPANNNVSEDNNNGPISLREMQNIANNNAAAYITSDNEERNRVSRESVVEFEPLPDGIRVVDPLERCVDWFGDEYFPRSRLQYLREIGRGWFGRVVEGEVDDEDITSTVAVKILNQNASLEDKARFLDEARLYRDSSHENILGFVACCLEEDPWILIFELCPTDLQTYLATNRPKLAALEESGVPLRLMCDVTSALAYLHSRGLAYGHVSARHVLVRGEEAAARAVLGHYGLQPAPPAQPEASSDVQSLGTLLGEICAWGAAPPRAPPGPACLYGDHLYQVMQLCWNTNPAARVSAAQAHALLGHLLAAHARSREPEPDHSAYGSSDFEERWQRLKPNTIPKLDEHVAIVHAPSTSGASNFTGSQDLDLPTQDSLSVDMDTAVSRSSSIMSDKDMSIQIKSESLTNLHGSLEDVRNIYLTHNEMAVLDCHQANVILEESKEHDRSDGSVDPWLKDIIAGSQDDVSYYRDVSDVIKNLDNILNSEKTSSSESSHQASPSRDNLSLDCKKDYPVQSSMVKSPGINNFQNILEIGFEEESQEKKRGEDEDRDTVGTLSHSFERHSDTTSQQTLENLTPDTPIRDMDLPCDDSTHVGLRDRLKTVEKAKKVEAELPKVNKIDDSDSVLPNLTDLCIASMPSVNEAKCEVDVSEDCQSPSDNKLTDLVSNKDTVEAKSISEEIKESIKSESVEVVAKNVHSLEHCAPVNVQNEEVLPEHPNTVRSDKVLLLPNAPVDDKNAISSRSEPTNTISQKKVTNDLIKPEESTIDSPIITQVDTSMLEGITPISKVDLLDNVRKISLESTPDPENDRPLPIAEIKEQSFPEKVQNKTTHTASRDSEISVVEEIKNDVENSSVDSTEVRVKDTQEELARFLANEIETEISNVINNKDPPTLIFTESQDEFQTALNLDEVSEKFVEQLIKEAEVFALSSIETANMNVVALVNTAVIKDTLPNSLNESEKKLLASDCINNAAILPEVLSEKLQSSENTPLSTFYKDDLIEPPQIAPHIADLENIANKLLIEAMQDVPKAIDDVKVSKNDVKNLENLGSITNLQKFLTEAVPDIVQDVALSAEQPILQDTMEKLDELSKHHTYATPLVLPQTSLDLESTTSADSSQCTFLIKDTLIEDCHSVVNKNTEPVPLEEIVQPNPEPEVNFEDFLNKGIEIDAKFIDFPETDVKLQDVLVDVELTPVVEETILVKDPINLQNDLQTPSTNKADISEKSNNSTAYMDLTNSVQTEILDQNIMDDNVKYIINSCLEASDPEVPCSLVKNESTVYLDLPNVIRQMDDFLHYERQLSSHVDIKDPMCSSTPKSSADDTQRSEQDKSDELSETKIPVYGSGVTLTKLEQQFVPDSLSPFESPTKSHPTDTYDENSSVVLGPFENCTMELFKGVKSDLVDIPKEELLAFSSNFSEMNLETPSPLRDGNFLKEVPDVVHDDIQFNVTSEVTDKDLSDSKTDVSDATDHSVTEKRASPSTPPNSPGYFLASTSQQKYLVDIDLNQLPEPAPVEPDSGLSSLHKEIELNQIELQITSKLAMAENENNLNIEYSGPLTVEGLVQDDLQQEEESAPETFLAGNGGCIENIRERFALDEDCVNALRNELELKLPLAQVAAIEPQCESESDNSWSSELPPPPELIVSYPGALSPIAEETGPQLSAYENDALWNTSARTDSSESYPEPCNNSEPTDSPRTLFSAPTYTLSRAAPVPAPAPGPAPGRAPAPGPAPGPASPASLASLASREITMSTDSLNGSPCKSNDKIDDRTFTKDDDKDACERISQVSPFILSPTTDTSAPDHSDVTGVSTLSKTTVPTDAKISKPSETHCLSKATSIDSWCSNDTLYNVEEAFDDLASDPELPADFDADKELDESESSHTLTLNDDKELSHHSTYVVHDSQSDEDRFSPDSITANDNANYTYTKAKVEVTSTSPSALTKSEVNDSKSQTKDLAYGTLMSGVPSYSNCTTELLSVDNNWKLPQPELVRRSPTDLTADLSNIVNSDRQDTEPEHAPELKDEPRVKKMDSVEISCLEDDLLNTSPGNNGSVQTGCTDSPSYHYEIAETVTSTPLIEAPSDDNVEPVVMTLPDEVRTPENLPSHISSYPSFLFSAEMRPQERSSPSTDGKLSETLPEGSSTRNASDTTPSYSEFENAATFKPQETSGFQSSQNGTDDFQKFEDSVRDRPQDLSVTPSALLLLSERLHSREGRPSQLASQREPTPLVISPPSITNLRESHVGKVNTVIITDLEEDETEQPHSIIIAEVSKDSPNRTFDSHMVSELNHTYDSHAKRRQKDGAIKENNNGNSKDVTFNGIDDESHNAENFEAKSPVMNSEEKTQIDQTNVVNNVDTLRDVPNGSVPHMFRVNALDIKCNGKSEQFATVNFINESFEELMESNVDDGDCKAKTNEDILEVSSEMAVGKTDTSLETNVNGVKEKMVAVTEDFLQNEKKFCQLDSYLPLLSDIRFTGPASEIMSTSFNQESPTEPEPERDGKHGTDMKDWDSDSDTHSSNSSSGEFIWKGGDGQETSVVPSTHFDHRGSNGGGGSGASPGDSGSGSGSEGDEVEFVPSSWDCRAEPAKSSLLSLRRADQDKKHVVFKRQKYHCVYEYPRELPAPDAESPAYLPDLSTYTEWDPTSAEDAELGYGQLFGAPAPLDLYPLRGTVAFGSDYDEDFFISSSARPFESLGVLSTSSQFFPGMHKPLLLDALPPLLPPLPAAAPPAPPPPPADYTPDSGVEDVTPGSTSADEDIKHKLPEPEAAPWRSGDSASSSESVSPSSPGGEALGGLRHTRDKLKLDLPPSPHVSSPRHGRVFSFVLDKPKRRPPEPGPPPLVMTDETPLAAPALALPAREDVPLPEPTFSTFGKSVQKTDPEQKIILTDESEAERDSEVKATSPGKDSVKGTTPDSGDEDSGIESSSKATLERNRTPNVS